jgi:hypothetical protein
MLCTVGLDDCLWAKDSTEPDIENSQQVVPGAGKEVKRPTTIFSKNDEILNEMRERVKIKKLKQAQQRFKEGNYYPEISSEPTRPKNDVNKQKPESRPIIEEKMEPSHDYVPEDSFYQEVSASFAAAMEKKGKNFMNRRG